MRIAPIHFATLSLVAMLASCGGNRGAHEGAVHEAAKPLSQSMRFLGRYDASDPAHVKLAWSASGFVARFKGTRIDALMTDSSGNDSFQVIVDGAPASKLTMSTKDARWVLAQGLADGEHEVAIEKRTEARVGEVEVSGLVVEGGALLPPSPPKGRKIELIGDSITAGYGDEGADEHCRFAPQTENEFITYGAIAARALGAEHATVAWSGKTIEAMTELYDRALPAHPEKKWDPNAFVPDVVIVNLGTNDVTRGDGEATFIPNYVKLLDRIRAQYPKALIVCALGPMLTDTYPPGKHTLTRAQKFIRASVAAKKNAGDAKIAFLEFPTQRPSDGYGCDYHPSMRTHELMGEQLSAFLETEMGWMRGPR